MMLHLHVALLAEVAPYLGAWIEIDRPSDPPQCQTVAPYLGAWIEI